MARSSFGASLPILAWLSLCAAGCGGSAAAAAPTQGINACTRSTTPPPRFGFAVLGSGGPRGFGRGASGYVVFVDGFARILIDAGPGAFVRLGEMDVDFRRLDTILLTHLHIDHSGDLPGVVKSRDLTFDAALTFHIFGPGAGGDYPSTTAFVDRLFGAQGAFAYLAKFRNPLTLDAVDLPTAQDQPVHEIFREGPLIVTSIAVDHDGVPAVAYRVAYGPRAVVVTGDLASKNDNMIRFAESADLLVYDTAVLDPPASPAPLYELHTPPKRIGEVAALAHVKSLLLSHIPPAVDQAKDEVLRSVHAAYGGHVTFASDCMRIDLTD
ncbi:MAG TPA: MBL fold metallo-hydrolase [Polyangiaceae bacterium]|jgi:ribonuclease BN (tRNA processing enzyme)|nr:MBL fold metallo-hydrolase [Polyangiaceae bacterium]